MKKSIYAFAMLVSVLMMSSCSRQYAHRTRTVFQFGKQELKEDKSNRALRKLERLNEKKVALKNDSLTPQNWENDLSVVQVPTYAKKKANTPNEKPQLEAARTSNPAREDVVAFGEKPAIKSLKKLAQPKKWAKEKATQDGRGLLYIILVVILVLIIIGLIRDLLGPALWSLIVLVALIALLGILLGWW